MADNDLALDVVTEISVKFVRRFLAAVSATRAAITLPEGENAADAGKSPFGFGMATVRNTERANSRHNRFRAI